MLQENGQVRSLGNSSLYPGLVRTYKDKEGHGNQEIREHVYVLDRKPPSSRLNEDPFSIYDDDNSHTHYFFRPGKIGFNGFKRSEVSSENVTCSGRDQHE